MNLPPNVKNLALTAMTVIAGFCAKAQIPATQSAPSPQQYFDNGHTGFMVEEFVKKAQHLLVESNGNLLKPKDIEEIGRNWGGGTQ